MVLSYSVPMDTQTVRGGRGWAVVAAMCVAGGAAAQNGVFDLPRGLAIRATVTVSETDIELDPGSMDVPMERTLRGVIGVLGPKELVELRKCQAAKADVKAGETLAAFAVVHLHGAAGKDGKHDAKSVRILRRDDGEYVAEEIIDPSGKPAREQRRQVLKPEVMGAIVWGWEQYRGPFESQDTSANAKEKTPPKHAFGEVFELENPLTPGVFLMTARVLGDRLLAGGVTQLKPTARDLGASRVFCRLPKGYRSDRAAGLVVWCDASPSGRPPSTFAEACDALGFIVVGAADAGNDRPSVERYQLAMDAMATAMTRYLIDPDRVYVSGISGGGRISSTLAACFPDVFGGAAPVVGLACFENVPNGLGQVWPGGFRKPGPKLFDKLKAKRIGVMTGEKDFNYPEITGAARIYQSAGCNLRVFSTPDMGHQMPTPAVMAEVLSWIDEPARTTRERAAAAAGEAWKTFSATHPEATGKLDQAAKAELRRIMREAAWSDPAWNAWQRLGAG